ncbi:MAG: cob(I)yrinic acid a,c-diamide adenosyltransferase [Chloroflexi bacterium]|nr:cob(I)yrinic acid a,c-diamide adenosyltransferase [Chloroflexota bacterium]
MTKFYTQTGDDGFTGRLGKGRLPKHDQLIEAVGTIDEASAALGMARAQCEIPETVDLLLEVQRDLYYLMAELSASGENASKFRVINEERLSWLEAEIDSISSAIETPREFIVPGDTSPGAALSLARSIIRRAERRVAELHLAGKLDNQKILPYLNRLSSLCFVLELKENKSSSITLAKKDR